MGRGGKREPEGLGYRPWRLELPPVRLAGAGYSRAEPLGLARQLHPKIEGLVDLPFPSDFQLETTFFAFGDRRYQTFKQEVLDRQIRNARSMHREFIATIPAAELAVVENGHELVKDAATACGALLAEARAALQQHGGATIWVASGYRTVEKEQRLWHSYFETYYFATREQRWRMAGGEFGQAAVDFMARFVGERKAAPGYSNHSAGIAVDFATKEGKTSCGASMRMKDAWKKTRFFHWLTDDKHKNSRKHGFAPYKKEPWHWEYRP
jgi:hypothetical protein